MQIAFIPDLFYFKNIFKKVFKNMLYFAIIHLLGFDLF